MTDAAKLELAEHKLHVIADIALTIHGQDVAHIADAAHVMREIARQYFLEIVE